MALIFSPALSGQVPLEEQLDQGMESGDYPAVAELAQRLLDQQPKEDRFWDALCTAYLETDDHDRAEKVISAWTVQVPNSSLLIECRGDVAYGRKNFDLARAEYEKALVATTDRKADVSSKLAFVAEEQKQWALAADFWLKAFEASPESTGYLLARADDLMWLDRWGDAISAAKKAAEINAADAGVQSRLPQFERLAAALPLLEELRKTPASDSGYAIAQVRLALVLFRAGFPGPAAAHAELAYNADPKAFSPALVAGYLWRASGEVEKAVSVQTRGVFPANEQDLDRVLKLIENLITDDAKVAGTKPAVDAWILQLKRLVGLKEPWYGIVKARQAMELFPNDPRLQAVYAGFLLDTDDVAAAQKENDAALKADPKLSDAWLVAARLALKRGDFAEALKGYQAAGKGIKTLPEIRDNAIYLEALLASYSAPPAPAPKSEPKVEATPKQKEVKKKPGRP